MYHLNYYNNLKSPEIKKSISIEEYVNLIRDGYLTKTILNARNEGKGSPKYERAKNLRPCVTFNFLFDGYKTDNNIISSTGLIYFDIDVSINKQLDYSKILIHHKSFGGNGSVIVVKVNGITEENFTESYTKIATELGIQSYIDNQAVKKSQFTVISFDKDILYNTDSFVFEAINEKVSFRDKLERKKNILPLNDTFCNNYSAIPFRMTNASDYVANGKEYQVFEGGIDVAQVNIPRNIQKGNRKNVLLAILNQIVAINIHMTYGEVTKRALMINHIITKDLLPEQEVIGAVNSIWRYKLEGTLKLKLNKARKLIFSEYCSYTKDEKVAIVNKEIGALRSKKTKQEIYNAIEDWNLAEKITQKGITNKIQKSLPTIKRYWGEFKELVEIHNNNLKFKAQTSIVKMPKRRDKKDVINPVPKNSKVFNHTNSFQEIKIGSITKVDINSVTDLMNYLYQIAPNRFSNETIQRYYSIMKDSAFPCTHENICKAFMLGDTPFPNIN